MNLDEAQKIKVAAWVAEGLKLSDIQRRLGTELGVHLTYMEVRFLVDDLKLMPKDPERPKSADLNVKPAATATAQAKGEVEPESGDLVESTPPPTSGKVSVSVDQLTRPGAIVSGGVTFSDGKSAQWYLDQMGRLGLVPKETGYRPSAADLQDFQIQLQSELARMGF